GIARADERLGRRDPRVQPLAGVAVGHTLEIRADEHSVPKGMAAGAPPRERGGRVGCRQLTGSSQDTRKNAARDYGLHRLPPKERRALKCVRENYVTRGGRPMARQSYFGGPFVPSKTAQRTCAPCSTPRHPRRAQDRGVSRERMVN